MVKMAFRQTAQKELDKLPHALRKILLLGCREIFDDWTIGKPLIVPLSGFRVHRVGVYRIIYEVKKSSQVEIVAVGHRRDIYKRVR